MRNRMKGMCLLFASALVLGVAPAVLAGAPAFLSAKPVWAEGREREMNIW